MATERPKFEREAPPPRNRGSGPARTSPVWALAAAAKAQPGVWLKLELNVPQMRATNTAKHVRKVLADEGYTFTTRKRGENTSAVYCRYGTKESKS